MRKIQTVYIIGMGSLGLLYADRIQETLGEGSVSFLLDEKRFEKYEGQKFIINGNEKSFQMTKSSEAKTADLIIVSVKYNGLETALTEMEKAVGDDTIIISVLNGISSEEIISKKFGSEKVIYTVAQAMDAMKSGNEMKYTQFGELRIGVANGGKEENLKILEEYFDRSGVKYVEEENIIRRMWGKFMLNVGINQTCMVFGKPYREVLAPGEARDAFEGAMREVILLSEKENINLDESDLQNYIHIIGTLAPDGTPSMGQDRIAKRKSEVELFSGTVIKLAEKHGVPVPVNTWLYEQVQKIESSY